MPTKVPAHLMHDRHVVQVQMASTGAYISSSVSIPFDDSIPQITEGVELVTVSITPKKSTNLLLIEGHAWGSFGNTGNEGSGTIAIFRDSTADALAASISSNQFGGSSSLLSDLNVAAIVTAGSTSSTTFRLRSGGTNASTHTFNGWSGARKMGGVGSIWIRVTEVTP